MYKETMTSMPVYSDTSSVYSTVAESYCESVLDLSSIPKTCKRPNQLKFDESIRDVDHNNEEDYEEDIMGYYTGGNSSTSSDDRSDSEYDLIIAPCQVGKRSTAQHHHPHLHLHHHLLHQRNPSILSQSTSSSISRNPSQIKFQLPPRRNHTIAKPQAGSLDPNVLFSNPRYSMTVPTSSPPSYNINHRSPAPKSKQQNPCTHPTLPTNPYANSLWYNTRGSFGNKAIDAIQERLHKQILSHERKRVIEQEEEPFEQSATCVEDPYPEEEEENDADSVFVPPKRFESLRKKVDSPIADKHFFSNTWEQDTMCPSPKYKGLSPSFKTSKFEKAIKELYKTELKYATDLELVDSVYRTLLKSRKFKNIVSSQEESFIFSNIEVIRELSSFLVKTLRKEVSLNRTDEIGTLLCDYFIRIRSPYSTYFATHESQLAMLSKCQRLNGPKYEKWLSEAAYLCKSQSDCWDFESLIVKPVQRISKYLILLNVMLEGVNDDEVEQELEKAKDYLERWLNELNSNTKPTTLSAKHNYIKKQEEEEDPVKKQIYHQHQEAQHTLQQSISEFKSQHSQLLQLKKSTIESLQPLLKFISYHRHLVETWSKFMSYQEQAAKEAEQEQQSSGCHHYIESVYTSYVEKLHTQETQTKLTINAIHEHIIHAIELTLETCSSVKYYLKSQSNRKAAYLAYLGNPGSGSTPSQAVQVYITTQNQLQDELPSLNSYLGRFKQMAILRYTQLITQWLETLAGERQVKKYLELSESGEFSRGDNFDIIELFSAAKITNREALRDLCVDLKNIDDCHDHDDYHDGKKGRFNGARNEEEVRISSSRVVRRLFGV